MNTLTTLRHRLISLPDGRWNMLVMGTDIAFFTFGLNISSAYTILPLFAAHLTHENWLIALIPSLRTIGIFGPPLLVAGAVERRARIKPFMLRVTLFERIPFLVLAVAALLLAHGYDGYLLVIFFILVFLQAMGGGLTFPSWLDLIARAIPGNVRGRFLGNSTGAGNILGTAGAAIAATIVVTLLWPWNYALCFTLSFVAVAISFVLLASVREPERVVAAPRVAVTDSPLARTRAWVGGMWQVVRVDGLFQRYLAATAFSGLAMLGSGLLAVAALKQAHLSEQIVASEATVLIIASTVANFFWGWFGDRFGHRPVLVWGSVCMAGAMGLELLARNVPVVTLAFFLFGFGLAAIQLAQLSYVVDFGTPARRPTYIGLSFLVYTPFAALAPVAGGIIADRWGYTPAFALSTAIAFGSAVAFWRWVRDPQPHLAAREVVAIAEE